MAPEHQVCCGGAAARGRGPRLDLDLRPGGNVILGVEAVRRSWLTTCPPGLLDLLEVATYVYAADQAAGRGDRAGDGSGRRRFRFRTPVRLPEIWAAPQALALLGETLGFLTEDE